MTSSGILKKSLCRPVILLWVALIDELFIVLGGGLPTYVRELAQRHARGDFSSEV